MSASPALEQRPNPYYPSVEEPFESSFSFLNEHAQPSDHSMDHYFASPPPPQSTSEAATHYDDSHDEGAERDETEVASGREEQGQESSTYSLGTLILCSPLGTSSNMHEINLPYNSYAGYAQPISNTSQSPSYPYHTDPRDEQLSPRYQHNSHPLSPPLSASPPGSLRHLPGVLTTPPHSISPTMVSPASALDSGFSSDVSPISHWGYHQPMGTPLTNVTALASLSPQMSPGMAMVQGYFPQQTQTSPRASVSRSRVSRPRAGKTHSMTRTIKQERKSSDDEASENEGVKRIQECGSGLGFTTSVNNEEERIPMSTRPEAIKKARIESEQYRADGGCKRRRDELRKGFERVKDVLPQSNQRASKSNILDRAVAHIEQIHASNNFLLAQLEQKEKELASLRAAHQDLASIMARRTDSDSNKSSPQRQ